MKVRLENKYINQETENPTSASQTKQKNCQTVQLNLFLKFILWLIIWPEK